MAWRYVIDANLTLSLFLRLPYSNRTEVWMQERQAEDARPETSPHVLPHPNTSWSF